eukprot:3534115-Pyramimonas_sp.AAC.1
MFSSQCYAKLWLHLSTPPAQTAREALHCIWAEVPKQPATPQKQPATASERKDHRRPMAANH